MGGCHKHTQLGQEAGNEDSTARMLTHGRRKTHTHTHNLVERQAEPSVSTWEAVTNTHTA